MSHILVWHYPPLVRSQRLNRVRHSGHSQARRALGNRRPHSNRVSTSACDTHLNCIVVMSHILVWHYPPLVRSQRSNRVRHSSDSQARRALGSRRPHSNRVSTSACDTRLNCIVLMSHILVWHYPPLVRSQRSNRVTLLHSDINPTDLALWIFYLFWFIVTETWPFQ